MENTPKTEVVDHTESKGHKCLKYGLIIFSTSVALILILLFVLFFTDFGTTIIEKVEDWKSSSIEEQVEEEEEVEEETVSLENEGWSLYSIPEYGFSVEIPETSTYDSELDQYMRWEVSRGKEYSVEKDSLESVNINYYPSGFSPDARGCGQGCNGEAQITMYIYDKDTQYSLQEIKIEKQEELDSWNGLWEGDEGYQEALLSEYIKDPDPFDENVWCVNLPEIADGNFRECYFEQGNYLIEIVHTGLNVIDGSMDARSTELYNILKTMKFE